MPSSLSQLPLLLLALATPAVLSAVAPDDLVRQALAYEARAKPNQALNLLLQAERAGRTDAFVLQKIARQYADLFYETEPRAERKRLAENALAYSRRAAEADPTNAVNVLSIAISSGQLATIGDTREKVRLSRQVRTEAERALALDPGYAWAHHILGRWHREVADLGSAARVFVALFLGGLPAATHEDAVRHLERAVQLEPDELQHRVELGFAYLSFGDAARARSSFEHAVGLTARARIDHAALARARAALGDLQRSAGS